MSLDNLQLSASLVTSLYKTSLVEQDGAVTPRIKDTAAATAPPTALATALTEEPAPAAAPVTIASPIVTPPSPTFMGDNKKAILLLVHDTTAPYLEENAFDFLVSILNACQLSMADVALVNTHNLPAMPSLPTQLNSQFILLFGLEASHLQLPIIFPPYQVQSHDQRTYLAADSLQLIEKDKALKGKLWQALKKMFQL